MNERQSKVLLVAVAIIVTLVAATIPVGGELSIRGQFALATMAFAAILWITGALPLPVTALLIPVTLTVFGVYPRLDAALRGFADPVIFLILAGFMLANALTRHEIDKRIALIILTRIGSSPRKLVFGVMLTTALLSMGISNTATTAMMIPIAIGLVGKVTDISHDTNTDDASNFQVVMLLGTAYAASLGGVGTLIGTPPNAIVVGQLRELLGVTITFVEWLAIGLPMVVVTLPIAWFLLLWVYPPEVEDVSAARKEAERELESLGPLPPAGRWTTVIFGVTALLWLVGGLGFLVRSWIPTEWYTTVFGGSGITIFGTTGHQGILYFVIVGLLAIPGLILTGAVEWDDVVDIDWGTLILFGGGISLAKALSDTNATLWLADQTIGSITGTPFVIVLFVIIGMVVLVGELASNTAMAAILAPLLITVGPAYAMALGTSNTMAAVFLAVAGAIAASYGFALPVATPPNAIAFGAGYVTRRHMLRAGILLDVVIISVATGVIWVLIQLVWPVILA